MEPEPEAETSAATETSLGNTGQQMQEPRSAASTTRPQQSCLLTFSTALEHLKANKVDHLVPTTKVPDQRYFDILPAIGTARVANPNFTVPVIQLPSANLPGRFADEGARYAAHRRIVHVCTAALLQPISTDEPCRPCAVRCLRRLLEICHSKKTASHVLHHVSRDRPASALACSAAIEVVRTKWNVLQGVCQCKSLQRAAQHEHADHSDDTQQSPPLFRPGLARRCPLSDAVRIDRAAAQTRLRAACLLSHRHAP